MAKGKGISALKKSGFDINRKIAKIHPAMNMSETFNLGVSQIVLEDEENRIYRNEDLMTQAERGLCNFLGISSLKSAGMRITTNPNYSH